MPVSILNIQRVTQSFNRLNEMNEILCNENIKKAYKTRAYPFFNHAPYTSQHIPI